MQFTRLKLQGFKSFVEPTELKIDGGMTGIVGPNGCGKSNLVEALRWVMGETSPKRMRGSEMDDVIFAGTTTRPSRNLAEVMLTLANSERTATAEFNDSDELMVMRQIERGSGSDYRINGKPVRQRDVQLLFADQATGAHSTSVVGQGQIDALIRAKPSDRRQILEEASGTAGLQARRHEAELKLKGAESNLTRVDDVLGALDSQLRSLKTQVRQASRYRNLAEHIRRTEAALLKLRWSEAEANAESVRVALEQAEARVNELMAVVTQETTQRTEIAAELPALRQTEATAAAVVQKLVIAREQVEAETRRLAAETSAEEQRLSQASADRAREQSRQHDGTTALEKLTEENQTLSIRAQEIEQTLPGVAEALAAVNESVEALDATLNELLETVAVAETKHKALLQESATLEQKKSKLSARRTELETQIAALIAETAARPDLSLAVAMVEACETELAKRQDQSQSAEQARRDAETAQQQKREVLQDKQAVQTGLNAEANAIRTVLQQGSNNNGAAQAVVNLVSVAPGLETALAVALGEALSATTDKDSALYWRELPALADAAPLPGGVTPLSQHIKAPAALQRSLSQIGLVDSADQGHYAVTELQPGQILVSRDGWAWRWDGFTVTPQAKTQTAIHLQQRNRLTALESEIEIATAEVETAQAAFDAACTVLRECQTLDQQTRVALQSAFAAINDARDNYTRQERETTAANTRRATLDESLQQVSAELEQIMLRTMAIVSEIDELPSIEALRLDIAAKRTGLAEQRSEQAQHQGARDHLGRESRTIADRLAAIANERNAWEQRMAGAISQISALDERIAAHSAHLEELRAKPAELQSQHTQLMDELSVAETARKEAADTLIAAEHKLSGVEQQLKRNESSLNDARENRVRAQAAIEAASEHFTVLRERITEKLSCAPEELAALVESGSEEETSSANDLEQTLGRYVRERENMGPVNLRAEVESESVQTEIDRLTQEKDDLVAAIAKLRQGIGQLNKEARERLNGAFSLVNERFQKLFGRLFNGGKAHLELIDNEDPLNAGLEIYAAPPGKKVQVLSLLSGGERTLTALALLFAVFQTNPSPICVLDEAEAALDESNIDRFCGLIEDIAKETGTRFLIITHQRLTMARMDRLYGVTMSEKGVSQLVSVDLAAAVAIRDGELLADDVPKTAAEESLAAVQAA